MISACVVAGPRTWRGATAAAACWVRGAWRRSGRGEGGTDDSQEGQGQPEALDSHCEMSSAHTAELGARRAVWRYAAAVSRALPMPRRPARL